MQIQMNAQATSCPACGSTAYYRYGTTKNGKKRRLCLVCNRQYIVEGFRRDRPDRPTCPACNQKMHVYMRQVNFTRYRCRRYPQCRTFMKIPFSTQIVHR
jgi:formate dehydrogenase maturation protein FdhE